MAKEDLTVPFSIPVPFIEAQQVDHASRYHSFEFVSVNYTPERMVILEPKLSNTQLIASRYLMDRQYEPSTVPGNHGDWIVVPIEVKSQDTTFGLVFLTT